MIQRAAWYKKRRLSFLTAFHIYHWDCSYLSSLHNIISWRGPGEPVSPQCDSESAAAQWNARTFAAESSHFRSIVLRSSHFGSINHTKTLLRITVVNYDLIQWLIRSDESRWVMCLTFFKLSTSTTIFAKSS